MAECCPLGMLHVHGPVIVHGFTFKVTFWLGLRRRMRDETWVGVILSWNLLYVHFTRASDRLYILMEDLRQGILLPRSGALRARGLALGVTGSDHGRRNMDDALVRRQLFLANLKYVSDKVLLQLKTFAGANHVIGSSHLQ